MKKKWILTVIIVGIVFINFNLVSAGSANLTIVHEKPDLKVVKYMVKYGNSEKVNPEEYPNTREIIPYGGGLIQSTTLLDLGNGVSGEYFFSVKDVYEDGSVSEYSESSFPIIIPKKPLNLKIK